jgi:hypothetical protein
MKTLSPTTEMKCRHELFTAASEGYSKYWVGVLVYGEDYGCNGNQMVNWLPRPGWL